MFISCLSVKSSIKLNSKFTMYLLLWALLVWAVMLTRPICIVLQLIVLFYGVEFLWRKSAALIGYFGFGPEYEVFVYILFVDCVTKGRNLLWSLECNERKVTGRVIEAQGDSVADHRRCAEPIVRHENSRLIPLTGLVLSRLHVRSMFQTFNSPKSSEIHTTNELLLRPSK